MESLGLNCAIVGEQSLFVLLNNLTIHTDWDRYIGIRGAVPDFDVSFVMLTYCS